MLEHGLADLGLEIVRVGEWSDALTRCAAPEWEASTLDAHNAVTEHLHSRYPNRYASWNQVVAEVNREVISPIVDPAIQAVMDEHRLSQVFADCVRWDIVGAATEVAFAACHPPDFSRQLLSAYEQGHFPCGWDGVWPEGRLVVF